MAVCLSVVNELTDQIQDANWKILASVPVRQQNGDKHMTQNVTSSKCQNVLLKRNAGIQIRMCTMCGLC